MTEFKVGDKVRVVPDKIEDVTRYQYFLGREGYITAPGQFGFDFLVDFGGTSRCYPFNEDELEVINV